MPWASCVLLAFLLARAATAHPAALACTSDAASKLRVPVPADNSTLMMHAVPVQVTAAQARKANVSMSVRAEAQTTTLIVSIPDGVYFVARVDRGGAVSPSAGNNRTANTPGCAGQVITPSAPTPVAGAYHFDLKVFAEQGSHVVLGYAAAHGQVSLLRSDLVPQNVKPKPPAPAPAPAPAPSSAPSKRVGHAKNISLGPDMRMDFGAVGDDGIDITVRMPGKHAWIGFGLAADGTMAKSELFVCDVAGGGRGMRYWSVANGHPENGEIVNGSSCSSSSSSSSAAAAAVASADPTYLNEDAADADGGKTTTTMTFTRKIQGSGDAVVPSREIRPGTDQSIIYAHGATGAFAFAYHGSNCGSVSVDFSTGAGGGGQARSPAVLVVLHVVLMGASWGALLPWGAALANRARVVSGNGEWFKLHRRFQYVGWALQIVGFAAIFAHVAQGSSAPSHFLSTHAKLGLVVTIVGTLQPLNAMMRPHPTDEKTGRKSACRAGWELWHKGIGWSAVLGGLLNVVLGAVLLNSFGYSSAFVVFVVVLLAVAGVAPVVVYFASALASPRANACSRMCVAWVAGSSAALADDDLDTGLIGSAL